METANVWQTDVSHAMYGTETELTVPTKLPQPSTPRLYTFVVISGVNSLSGPGFLPKFF